jgi:hypothetical protein
MILMGYFCESFLLMADWVETLSIGNFAAEFYYDAINFNELGLILVCLGYGVLD